MDPSTFFKNQLNSKASKKTESTTALQELYTKPKKEKGDNMPKFQTESEGYEQQADLLYLPNDSGYLYCLVVIDQGSRKIDCDALKDRGTASVSKALKKIYARKIIEKPSVIRVDAGSEFHKDFKTGLEDMGIQLIVAKAGRHRAMALVERMNYTIGSVIHKLITQNALAGYESSKWVEYLPELVKAINERTAEKKTKKKKKQEDKPIAVEKGTAIKMLNMNDPVRILLDNPQDIHGKRLHGTKFRASDIRWSPQVYKITHILVQPNEPILYLTTADVHARTFEQLLPVKENVEAVQPVGHVEQNRMEVEKILERRKKGRSYEYLIKWRHLTKKQATWESRKELMKDIPQMVKRFDEKQNKKD